MNLPLEVTASDGKKYFDPSRGPFTPYLSGSCAWRNAMTATNAATTPPIRRAHFQRIIGPASLCLM